MAEKKNEVQQQDAFDNNAGTQQQPATESAPADGGQSQQAAAQQPLPPKDEDGLVKISQGLPPQLKPLQNCFTAPYKTFLQNGKDIRDLQRECNFAAQAMLNNPYLIQCAQQYPDHFVNALKNVVLTGMTLNPTLKLAYLVPYKGKVELQASYMGKKSFGVNTGLVLDMVDILFTEILQGGYNRVGSRLAQCTEAGNLHVGCQLLDLLELLESRFPCLDVVQHLQQRVCADTAV